MMQLAIANSARPPVWLVKPRYLIGRDESCDLQVDDESLGNQHLILQVDGDTVTLLAGPGLSVRVNRELVTGQRQLAHGDRLTFGRTELYLIDPKVERARGSSPPAEDAVWSLHGLGAALNNTRYFVTGTRLLGRARECDICLAVAHLSRQHARLKVMPDGLLVEDLASSNGTYVNGERISRALVKSGDELRFDSVRFRVLAPNAGDDPDKTCVRQVAPQPLSQSEPAPVARRPRRSRSGAARVDLADTLTPDPAPDASERLAETGEAVPLLYVWAFIGVALALALALKLAGLI